MTPSLLTHRSRNKYKLAIRFVLAALGGFVAFFFIIFIILSSISSVVLYAAGLPNVDSWVYGIAVLGGLILGILLAVRYVRNGYSLERLWVFAIGLHVLSYVLLIPHLWVGPAFYYSFIRTEPLTSIVYSIVTLGIFLITLAGTYHLVYRGGYDRAKGWLAS